MWLCSSYSSTVSFIVLRPWVLLRLATVSLCQVHLYCPAAAGVIDMVQAGRGLEISNSRENGPSIVGLYPALGASKGSEVQTALLKCKYYSAQVYITALMSVMILIG